MNPLAWLYGNGYGFLINVLQLACIVHALVRRRDYYWLLVILMLPGIGAMVYAYMNILPEFRGLNVAQLTEPLQTSDMRVRRAQAALEDANTLHNRLNLARELKRAGKLEEAASTLEPLRNSVYRDDPLYRFEHAELQFLSGRHDDALELLGHLLEDCPLELRGPAWLLRARMLEAKGATQDAESAFQTSISNASSEEARTRFASYLIAQGRHAEAIPILEHVQKNLRRAQGVYRSENREWAGMTDALLRQVKPGA